MLLDPFLLMLLLFAMVLGFVLSLFLPSIIEVLKPKDRGPRKMLKKPLHQMIRHGHKIVFASKLDSVDGTNALKDLQDVLEKNGVKTQRIGKDTVRIFGDITFPPKSEVVDNIVVDGTLTVGDRCVFHGSIKAKGNVIIGSFVVIKGNLISERNVDIQDETVIGGSVHAEGWVRLGEKIYVGSSVVADGDVELYENSEVKESIITHGVIKVLKCPKLGFPPTIEDIG